MKAARRRSTSGRGSSTKSARNEALGMKTPAEMYAKSERAWKGTPGELEHEGMSKRKVCARGNIRCEGPIHFLSSALAGWDVGLKAGPGNKVEVYFGRRLLGQIELESALPSHQKWRQKRAAAALRPRQNRRHLRLPAPPPLTPPPPP